MVALPVSGIDVALRRPGGEEHVLLCEATRGGMSLTVALLSRLAEGGEDFCCGDLPVCDVELLLLELRRLMFGDVVRSTTCCPAERCGAAVDVTFRISDYVAHHAPRRTAGVVVGGDGWMALENAPVQFRVPLASDQIAVGGRADAARLLVARCVRPAEPPARLLARVARALERLAPSLADSVCGTCPECRTEIEVYFDPQEFTFRELRAEASLIYEDIHLLASRYGWSEPEIMALPRARRMRYAELLHRDQGGL
jgi:hypothetical protein